MSAEQRKEDKPVGHKISGTTSDKLRDHIEKTGDNTTWQGTDGEMIDRGGRYDSRP
jgi:hypothetical protein